MIPRSRMNAQRKDKWCVPLRNFYSGMNDMDRQAFQIALGWTNGRMQQKMYGLSKITAEDAISIHKVTNGMVSFFETRPDIDWIFVQNASKPNFQG